MGRPRILDEKLMQKIAKKLGKRDLKSVNILVSKKADKLGVSPEAALILIAKEQNIGAATFQRSLDSAKQNQVRDALPAIFTPVARASATSKTKKTKTTTTTNRRAVLRAAIEYLIQDTELRDRCTDILMATSKFDRPINQATLVLEDRIRNKAQPTARLVGDKLVNFAFNEELTKTVLQVPSGDPDDQRGFTQIIRGTVAAFRNKTHHHVVNSFSREDALRVCGFIDVLLRVVDNSTKIR